MTSQEATTADLRADLGELSSLAVTILNEHVNEAGLCAVCWRAWPCELVILADHNYGLATL
jgi:hypothetical protein